jgi:putative polyhydroxyalkanoate system protein
MPKLAISQPHRVGAEEARRRIDGLARELGDKYGLTSRWTSDTVAEVTGSGATGQITVEPEQVDVTLDLPFVLSPMKGRIESRIRDELQKLFGQV